MSEQETRKLLDLIKAGAEDKKARNITILELGELSIMTDYFVIMSGNSTTQVRAIADGIEEKVKEGLGVIPLRREGLRSGRWILLDYGQAVVHVFLEEERQYYNLERLWGEAKRLDS
ncbi:MULTISPECIES: ribosome silencing factor [Carboxydocella]|uniref:Ribosomal silencing factor RsfS n=2 Tax=Carboxydocella TaxID=178898 RepID=A0A1T4L3Z2_9FIRM|nr:MULTISPECIES: ribosome silencing factor [Carboxydocella]AVX19977.1 ribosome-associated protein [Carboxydocella thermautotrophica]AVX30399.1 ribosome-associated protein [Carboxydocella thermautotrophica]SJZ49439.1 ribosome-associated protein [Carboxydocella sporoproducens DSM 16521]GAW28032.1 ribosome-associated protein [Carboxydocella sp. ULO1]GAW32350.1 ribosome-associated protein [Carboxydocella sp. JDF658]